MIPVEQYETWFLLYADGELSPEDMQQVEALLIQYPHLQESFDAIMSARMEPDEEIVLADKSFLRMEPIELLEQQYRLEPDRAIVFPDKSLLYRHAGSIRPMQWFRPLMAAASVLLTVGLAFYFFNGEETIQTPSDMGAAVVTVTKENQREPQVSVNMPIEVTKPKAISSNRNHSTRAVHSTPEKNQADVVSAAVDVLAESATIASTTPVTFEAPQRSNFTQDALEAAAIRMSTPPVIQEQVGHTPNAAVILQAALKDESERPLRGIIRKIGRKLTHEEDEDQDVKFIQVANFHLHVKK